VNLEVRIDHGGCVATGSCAALAPEYLEPGADGKPLIRCAGAPPGSEARLAGLSADASNRVREAAMFCPPEAIEVRDADSDEQYFP
jgi:ferredoxin